MNGQVAWLAWALTGILAGCSASTAPTAPSQTAGLEAQSTAQIGARLYDGNCIACHQPDARGIPGAYPSLFGSRVLLGDPRELALWVVKGQRPRALPSGRYSTTMPHYDWLKPADAAALLTYVRTHFGNAAPAVDPAVVARAVGDQP